MEKNYLVIDLGTGNTRVALVSEAGILHAIASFENRYEKDECYEDATYFVPREWEGKILAACREVMEANPEIRVDGITSSGARESIVLYDETKTAFLGLPNIDNRGRAWVGGIPEKEFIYEKTGRWVTEDFPAAKLLGYRKKYEQEYRRISRITSISEWVGEIFTGQLGIEPSQACETQLYDIGAKCWSAEICASYGIDPALLPPVLSAGTRLGFVKPELYSLLPFHGNVPSGGLPFIIGGADTQVAVKGAEIREDDIAIVSGTTSPVVAVRKEKFYDRQERCWTNCNLGGDTYLVECNPGVTGLNYQRLRTLFFSDMTYNEIEAAMRETVHYSCTASFSTLLFAKRRSLKQGGFVLRAPLGAEISRTDFAWAVVADIACSIYVQYQNLVEMIGSRRGFLIGCGGGFQSGTLCQMVADLTGKELILRDGFAQATIAGCIKICNEYFGISRMQEGKGEQRYQPCENPLIRSYFIEWNQNREKLNQ